MLNTSHIVCKIQSLFALFAFFIQKKKNVFIELKVLRIKNEIWHTDLYDSVFVCL